MAFLLERSRSFPDFEESREYFRTGVGTPPEQQITSAPAAGGVPGAPETGGPVTYQPPTGGPTTFEPQTAQAQQPAAPPPEAPQAPQAPGLPTPPVTPYPVGYQETGGVEERLFQPVQAGVQTGEEQLTQFADVFREQAGPERTYAGIGAPGTLEAAVAGGGAAMEPARELVGAEYTGPASLDPGGEANLRQLAADLRLRQQALGTGGGIAETLRRSTEGYLTPGEARYTARDVLTPEYVQRLGAATAGVDPFGQRLETEALGATELGARRQQQEADIARQSGEYLTGRRGGIETGIQSQIDQALAEQAAARGQFTNIMESPDMQTTLQNLRAAEAAGTLTGEPDISQLMTPAQQAMAATPEIREQIMAKYPTIAGLPLGVPGVGRRGKPSPFVMDPESGELKDYRDVIPKEQQKAWTDRQAEFEQGFNPLRQGWMDKYQQFMPDVGGVDPELLRTVSPLYYGTQQPGAEAFAGGFEAPRLQDPAGEYLDFDPGMRPSRGNISTGEQRDQFNRINDLLGNLDRISESESPFRAASLAVNVEKYLEDEEAALEAKTEDLDQQGREWKNQVKRLRKQYKKLRNKEKWGSIMSVLQKGVMGSAAFDPTALVFDPNILAPVAGKTLDIQLP